MATSKIFTLLGPSIFRSSGCFSRTPQLKFNNTCISSPLRFKRYSSSALTLDSDTSVDDSSPVSAHPWPEWVNFVDRLKAKGYLSKYGTPLENDDTADDEGAVAYTDMKVLKEACLSFARERFDIFRYSHCTLTYLNNA